MWEAIVNPLLALGGIVLFVAFFGALIYVNDRYFKKGRKPAPQAQQPAQVKVVTPVAPEPPRPAPMSATTRVALSALLRDDNLLIVGPKGSGKTTLIRSLIAQRDGAHVALDPHSSPGKWPCAVVGGGRDYNAIDLMLDRLHADMDARFKDLARGVAKEGAFPRRTVVGDEFRSIVKEIEVLNKQREKEDRGVGASQRLLARISEGRKVGECALVAAHADTVKALGIEGEGDLRACFDWIVYLGALAVKRVPEAEAMGRPAVAYHTDRDRFYLLDFDIPVVREGEQVSEVSEDDDLSIFIPLRQRVATGAAFRTSPRAETNTETHETISALVSGFETSKTDDEMLAFQFLARLVRAGAITETTAIEIACGVKAGSSKSYQDARAKFKRAAETLDTRVTA